ncbi:hypothetical protein GE061_008892 [Apolygus lucorum]|uniref:LRRNT domain-containing protein n=1 Tax=Apolygus lucorum TaxID=248454 RepID=A0A8S9XZ22_APOLU|nr:hypothetical protein GE061_008892 [Apolygus lucorum]
MKGLGMCLRPLLIVCWFCQTMSLCPTDCWCGLDSRGRRQVICAKGGMEGAIPVAQMDLHTEILKITAPIDNENSLTIGPIFHEFQQLSDLQITYSNVPAIGKHSFWGVPSLKHLNLTNNNISQVLEYNFRGLVNLLELHLDHNRIESMGSGTFHHLPELRTLTLSYNRLKHLSPRLFLMLGKLRTLDLSYNELEHLDPEVFKDVQDLRTFSCRGCMLRKMNPHIYSLLSSLTHLDIGLNEFKYLDSHEFRDLKKLQVLLMDGNHFPRPIDWSDDEDIFTFVMIPTKKYGINSVDIKLVEIK